MRTIKKIRVREQVRTVETLLIVIEAFFAAMSIVPMCIMKLCGFGIFEICVPTIIAVPFLVMTIVVSCRVDRIMRIVEGS